MPNLRDNLYEEGLIEEDGLPYCKKDTDLVVRCTSRYKKGNGEEKVARVTVGVRGRVTISRRAYNGNDEVTQAIAWHSGLLYVARASTHSVFFFSLDSQSHSLSLSLSLYSRDMRYGHFKAI